MHARQKPPPHRGPNNGASPTILCSLAPSTGLGPLRQQPPDFDQRQIVRQFLSPPIEGGTVYPDPSSELTVRLEDRANLRQLVNREVPPPVVQKVWHGTLFKLRASGSANRMPWCPGGVAASWLLLTLALVDTGWRAW
jgi:hypothetical protein